MLFSKAAELRSQIVTDKFDRLDLSENFDTINKYWTTLANAENLFIVQEGEYIINRKTIVSPFAIVADHRNNLDSYRMVTSLKLDRTHDENGSIGILFMAQADGRGGFIFEVNKAQQYRLRQIAGGAYKYVSGDADKGGWVTNKNISETNYNLVDIRTSNGNYDIYSNNNFIFSFTDPSYKNGKFGIVIGPGSKGRVDFIYIFSKSSSFENAANETYSPEVNSSKKEEGPDVIELAESIINLKTQINKLTEQNEDLRKTIEAMRSDDDQAENEKKNYEKTIKAMQAKIDKSALSFDSLLKVNEGLLKYKELVAGNENSDLIISLSKNLKNEKATSELLRKQNKELSDSLNVLIQKKGGARPAPVNTEKTEEIKPSDKGFVLPNESNNRQ